MDSKVSVVVSDAALKRFGEIVRRLETAGLRVEQALEQIGIVTGSISAGNVDALKKVEGVVTVEEIGEVRIPPPDSGVQ